MSTPQSPMSKPALKYSVITYLMLSAPKSALTSASSFYNPSRGLTSPDRGSSPTNQITGGKGSDWENEEPPKGREGQVLEHLRNMKVYKSMEPDEMYPWVLRAPVDEVAKPLSIEFEKTWQSGEVHSWWMRNWLDVTPQELWSQWKPVMSDAPQGQYGMSD
ncbi:hypothetical protein TURU_044191 [Turdus rufiventris]|nr:hypothetical protein TURU_044191 [Turdus rufiventris]